MNSERREARSANGGQFLLNLLQNPTNSNSAGSSVLQQPSQTLAEDPAVAAVGPSIDSFTIPRAPLTSEGRDFNYRPWNQSSTPLFAPHVYFQQNPNLNPDVSSQHGGFGYAPHQVNSQSSRGTLGENSRKFGSIGDDSEGSKAHKLDQNLIFGSFHRNVHTGDAGVGLNRNVYGRNEFSNSSVEKRPGVDGRVDRLLKHSAEISGNGRGSELRGYEQERVFDMVRSRKQVDEGTDRTWVLPPPGFSSSSKSVRNRENESMRRTSDHKLDKGNRDFNDLHKSDRLSNHIDSPGLQVGSSLRYGPAVDIGETRITHNNEVVEESLRYGSQGKISRDGDDDGTEIDDLVDHLADIQELEDVPGDNNGKKKHHRDKDYRSDNRGQWIMGQRMRNVRRHMACRSDVYKFDSHFLEIFNSLIPAEEEKAKQKQLLAVLEQLVVKEWPDARLYLYGSCANSFGFPKSDLDVCLVLELGDTEKSEVILKLADILQSGNLENVQALTRARVPIVKLMDPVTNISCDICVNNVLAVVNTKLLRDYARIDERLRQLAFIVKHWAKSRGVNETYRGTLSSYAYVLMCIHFLQQRRPPILPCLQGMNITYFATVDNVECGYFDQVDKLHNFGSRNRETVAQLVWSFFHYWAYCHDYASDVISVRTGSTLSKKVKDWTRRVGNDRHLICIEDPFEVSHDLGRVVDKFTIRVLREEFERAAEIMHHHSNPCARLFEPYVPN